MGYRLRRWWRQLVRSMRRFSRPGYAGSRTTSGEPSAVVSAFLGGASARECAYLYWHRGVTPELATARDWPSAVAAVEEAVRGYVDELRNRLEQQAEA